MTPHSPDLNPAGITNALRGCQLFSGLPLDEVSAVAEISVVKSLAKGAYLFHAGEVSHGFYIVQTGAINVHRVNAAGKEQVIHVFRAGESFAEGTLATDQGYPADARAVEDSRVLLVRKAGMVELLRRRPELALRMLGSMSLHLRTLVAQLDDLTLKDVETRLAHWILKHCPDATSEEPCCFVLPMTKRMLASELGTVSETFSRTLARFREQGLVEVEGRDVTVRAPAKLARLLQRNLGEWGNGVRSV